MKICKYCGKTLTSEQRHNTYCSQTCANKDKQQQKINAWLSGEDNGMRQGNALSQTIRNYLLEQANYSCEICGWNKINPVTQKVPLEIHHIDGNYENNRPDNLQVLCPNCHALTPNFKALNTSNRLRTQTRKENNYCIDCGKQISVGATRCHSCDAKQRITDKPVTREELKNLIRTTPFTRIGQQFGVSDNAIRKWCIQFDLPSKSRDIKQYTDKEWESL